MIIYHCVSASGVFKPVLPEVKSDYDWIACSFVVQFPSALAKCYCNCVVVVNHQHRGRWLGQVTAPSAHTSCCSAVVTPGAVALNGCGCEPSAQRPVVGSGAVPSAQTSCCSAVVRSGAVALKACGCEPSAQRPVVGSGDSTVSTDKLLFRQ